MINWNDGLSVGVKSIDDDHKKLLEIINTLSQAIERDEELPFYESIFSDLEKYVSIHFLREEALMKKCKHDDYEKHAKQHKEFADKIPAIKEKFFATTEYYNAKEVSSFLTDWLLNHILNEDMLLIDLFEKHGFKDKEVTKKSLITNLINETTHVFSFTKRMLLSAIIPMIGMLLFGAIILFGDYNKYVGVKESFNLTNRIYDINQLSHALQIERGLSSGYISSAENHFKSKLLAQRQLANIAYENLINNVKTLNTNQTLLVRPYISQLRQDYEKLQSIRKKINLKVLPTEDTILFYSKMIKNILQITYKIMLLNTDKEITYTISKLTSLLNIKETLGLQRAYGTVFIENKATTNQQYQIFSELLGAYEIFYDTFQQISTKEEKTMMESITDTSIKNQIILYKTAIKNKNYKNLDSAIWFSISTQHIDNIKIFVNFNLENMHIKMEEKLNQTIDNLILWFTTILLFVLLTIILIYIFEKSIKQEISKLVEGMKHLALGGRDIEFKHSTKNEIDQVFSAYESTRKAILRGDVFTQLYLDREKMRFNNERRQKLKLENLAHTDSLTSLINRRKFEEVSNNEIIDSLKYNNTFSLLMLDIDHFKKVNDTYGHAIGDLVLKHFANSCKTMLGSLDVMARIGGEEFIIMLRETNKEEAFKLAQRLCDMIYNSSLNIDNQNIKITVSIGVSTFDESKDTQVKDVLKRADNSLYKAKQTGRNKVLIA